MKGSGTKPFGQWVLALCLFATMGVVGPARALETGRIFVSSERDHGLTVLDGKTLEKVGVIKTGNRPRHLRLSGDRKLLYVGASDSHRVDVVDVAALKVVDRLDVGPDPE